MAADFQSFLYLMFYVLLGLVRDSSTGSTPNPTNITTVNIFDNSVTVKWDQVLSTANTTQMIIEHFEIQYCTKGNPSGILLETASGDKRQQTLGGLQANTTYFVKMRTVTRVWESDWVNSTFTTFPTMECIKRSLGMETRAVPDMYITSSSQLNSSIPPANARLNYVGGSSWCASTNDPTPYLQIDLGSPHVICAVATQGNHMANQWVKTYRLQFSRDGINWLYLIQSDQVKIFKGNTDRSTVVQHLLEHRFVARSVRFLPRNYHDTICMRVDLYGNIVESECTGEPIGLTSRSLFLDHRFTSTSNFEKHYMPYMARLGYYTGWAPSSTINPNDYLQVDMGMVYTICAVGTQGNVKSGIIEWVTAYQISLFIDNVVWTAYKVNGTIKTFTGNTDKNTLVKNDLPIAAPARFLRIKPTSYRLFKVLRVEVYGVNEECKESLGVENVGIEYAQILASSSLDNFHRAYHGRLYSNSSWCSSTTSNTEYIQVDLGQLMTVTGIATQGDPTAAKWVQNYVVSYSADGNSWLEYTAGQLTKKLLQGNSDNSSTIVNWLRYPMNGRYIRIIPQKWNSGICLRMDLYGCTVTCDNLPLGMSSGSALDYQIAAFSSYNGSITAARYARLHYTGGSSWCASTSDSTPYLQIDLGSPHVICAVATQGNYMADQWVERYQLQGSRNGLSWTMYSERGQSKNYAANFDRTSVVKQVLNEAWVVRYIRIASTSYQSVPCLRLELYGSVLSACRRQPVGIRWGGNIKDSHMQSTIRYSHRYVAHYGRLYNPISAWEASNTIHYSDYLEIDLGSVYLLSGLATQGHPFKYEWTIFYKISLSLDGISWKTYRENNSTRDFRGNSDSNTIVKHVLDDVTDAKFIRFYPLLYNGYKPLRVEIYGCQQGWRSSLGFEGGQVPDARISASSILDQDHRASKGRLYGTSSWCASVSASGPSYLEVDLGKAQQISGVATQGGTGNATWVTSYDLWFGYTRNRWFKYKNNQANIDQNGVTATWLIKPVGARYIRLLPKNSTSAACIRMEVYGNDQVAPPGVVDVTSARNLTATSGSFTELTCSFYAQPFVKLRWKKNHMHISSTDWLSSYAEGFVVSRLTVNFTSIEDMASVCVRPGQSDHAALCSSSFTCEAYYEGLVTSGPGRRSVQVYVDLIFPHFTIIPENQTIMQGSDILFPCSASGVPLPNVTWYFNGASLLSVHTVTGGNLSITAVQNNGSYEGNYTCVASSRAGTATRTVFLTVYAPPIILAMQGNTTVLLGTGICITCIVEGDPVPTIYWTKDGSRDIPRATFSDMNRTLLITNAQVSDEGVYHCKAWSRSGNDFSNISIRTEAFPNVYVSTPLVKTYLNGQRNVSIECLGSGYPKPYIKWIHGNITVPVVEALTVQDTNRVVQRIEKDVIRPTDNVTSFLYLHTAGLMYGDAGNYTCQVDSGVRTANKTIEVMFKPQLYIHPNGQVVKEGSDVTFHCSSSGAPMPLMSWLFNGRPLVVPHVVNGGNLTITDVKNNSNYKGEYTCIAKSRAGYVMKTVQLKIVDKCAIVVLVHLNGKFVPDQSEDIQLVNGYLRIDPLPDILTVVETSLVILSCEVTGDPDPDITWTKNGETNIPRATIKNDGRILIIQSASREDDGVYTCTAVSNSAMASTSTNLTVIGPPVITKESSSSTVYSCADCIAVLVCFARSKESVSYGWTKGHVTFTGQVFQGSGNSLVVRTKSKEDYGIYTCNATNIAGSTLHKVTLLATTESNIKAKDSGLMVSSIIMAIVVIVLICVVAMLLWKLRHRQNDSNRIPSVLKAATETFAQERPFLPQDPPQVMQDVGREYMELGPFSATHYQPLNRADESNIPIEIGAAGLNNDGHNISYENSSPISGGDQFIAAANYNLESDKKDEKMYEEINPNC